MALNRYGTGYPDPTNNIVGFVNPQNAGQNVKWNHSEIAVGAGEALGSIYRLARLPSYARLVPSLCNLWSSGIAGLTAGTIGLDQTLGGMAGGIVVPAALDAALTTLATAGWQAAATAMQTGAQVGAAGAQSLSFTAQLWQLLGLASDPKADIDVILTTGAATTAAGTLLANLGWTRIGA